MSGRVQAAAGLAQAQAGLDQLNPAIDQARGAVEEEFATQQERIDQGWQELSDGRAQLEHWVAEAERRFHGKDDIPVPDFWGGLRIVPTRVEFWQGRESRLHDRFVYEHQGGEAGEDGEWTLERLSP